MVERARPVGKVDGGVLQEVGEQVEAFGPEPQREGENEGEARRVA